LVRATLSAIPVHLSIHPLWYAFPRGPSMQSTIIEGAFLWSGSMIVAAGRCRVAWPIVCRPRELGGLVVIDLRMPGVVLRVRWEWLRRTAPNSIWARLPARRDNAVAAVFDAATFSIVGVGKSTLFWLDRWIDGRSISQLAPAPFATIRRPGRRRFVAQALSLKHFPSELGQRHGRCADGSGPAGLPSCMGAHQ